MELPWPNAALIKACKQIKRAESVTFTAVPLRTNDGLSDSRADKTLGSLTYRETGALRDRVVLSSYTDTSCHI